MSQLKNEVDVHTVTTEYTGSASRAAIDTSGPQLLSCAGVLFAIPELAVGDIGKGTAAELGAAPERSSARRPQRRPRWLG